ncbi:hypothetical protein FB451DRAFT_1402303 [Mycena latifolia]|nr:hypothetical protein FB451DRAFT_1402303 [Mycena latifolia]
MPAPPELLSYINAHTDPVIARLAEIVGRLSSPPISAFRPRPLATAHDQESAVLWCSTALHCAFAGHRSKTGWSPSFLRPASAVSIQAPVSASHTPPASFLVSPVVLTFGCFIYHISVAASVVRPFPPPVSSRLSGRPLSVSPSVPVPTHEHFVRSLALLVSYISRSSRARSGSAFFPCLSSVAARVWEVGVSPSRRSCAEAGCGMAARGELAARGVQAACAVHLSVEVSPCVEMRVSQSMRPRVGVPARVHPIVNTQLEAVRRRRTLALCILPGAGVSVRAGARMRVASAVAVLHSRSEDDESDATPCTYFVKNRDNSKENLSAISVRENSEIDEHLALVCLALDLRGGVTEASEFEWCTIRASHRSVCAAAAHNLYIQARTTPWNRICVCLSAAGGAGVPSRCGTVLRVQAAHAAACKCRGSTWRSRRR